MKTKIADVEIDNISMQETLDKVEDFIRSKTNKFIVTPNVDHIIRLRKDAKFRKCYKSSSLILADGMPILWAASFLGMPLKEKVSGSDLFFKLCELSARKGYKLFFLGGREGASKKSAEVMSKKFPSLRVVGFYCPPFGFENDTKETSRILEAIKKVSPDILFIGVGSPKQEKWIYDHKEEYNVPVSIGVGAAFDFASGVVRRSPIWMQKIGLEWLWRLMMEPKRLWKRYLIDDPVFFWLVVKQKLRLLK